MKILPITFSLFFLLSASLFAQDWPDPPLDVVPREIVGSRVTASYDFASDPGAARDWTAGPAVKLSTNDVGLLVDGVAPDPYFFSPDLSALGVQGDLLVKFIARRTTTGFAQIFVAERDKPDYDETRAPRFSMAELGDLREYVVPIRVESPLKSLRFDLGLDVGTCEIAKIEIVELCCPTVKFGVFSIDKGVLRVSVRNEGRENDELALTAGEVSYEASVEPGGSFEREFKFPGERPFEFIDVTASSAKSGDTTTRRFYAWNEAICDAAQKEDWPSLESEELIARFSPDGLGAEIVRKADSARVAALCPLVCPENCAPMATLQCERTGENEVVCRFLSRGKTRRVRFQLAGDALNFDARADEAVCAPVVRVLGTMEQAVVPGVEYLERGERSSSTLDVCPKERARFAPEPMAVTAPFAAIATDRVCATLVYFDPTAQVEFAIPDFLDGDESSSRMNARAAKIRGSLQLSPAQPIEEGIVRAVLAIGLPEPSERPRTAEEEDALHLAAMTRSALKVGDGWVSCVDSAHDPGAPHCGTDFLSTLWELTGEPPKAPRLNVGGANLRNYSSFLILDGAKLMRSWLNGEAAQIRASQRSDGSFRYSGKYLRGSSVDYASGDCSKYVFRLMDHWRLTGNKESLASGLKGLAFINELKTPRGAQTWELSLHTPDLVASARCSYANTLAYEATGDARYLNAARRWAESGLAFIYLWEAEGLPSERPVMKYASIPVFGTTDWIAPCWIGTPVQWCGLDYADAVLKLSEYDPTFNWRRVAEGIVASAEQQEYSDGPFIGLLPDSYNIQAQQRNPVNVNPCVSHLMRRKLDGKFTDVSVTDCAGRRVVAPFPTRVDGEKLTIMGKKGLKYQILIDGEEIREIESVGEDVVDPR